MIAMHFANAFVPRRRRVARLRFLRSPRARATESGAKRNFMCSRSGAHLSANVLAEKRDDATNVCTNERANNGARVARTFASLGDTRREAKTRFILVLA